MVYKTTYDSALKFYQVLRAILVLIHEEKQPFSSACFKRIAEYEANDSLDEIYQRRMGMKFYFKQLKMHVNRLANKGNKFSDSQI